MLEEYFHYADVSDESELNALYHEVTLKKDIATYKKGTYFPYVALNFSEGLALFFEHVDDEDGTEVKFTIKF